ncbi:MAG: 4Fe-4S dicluster domain-containing protein [Clostridia bacterium]|nr:4Fe-4S dicluster domain-containing protein [Clostridia bacterium]
MNLLTEEILIYGAVLLFCMLVVAWYLYRQWRKTKITEEKIALAQRDGLYEPVSLHPVVDPGNCIGTGACIAACPEKDILGMRNGKATTINASRCVGHGACFHACPTEAITLRIGTEQRGVELPHVSKTFETNVPGIYIAGELGGMGLIKNAVEQGRQAVDNLTKTLKRVAPADYDLVIIGAGPAGISASLTAKKNKLKFITLEQDTLGGTIFSFPRNKVVMTHPMDLPLHGRVKLTETSKPELLSLWEDILTKNEIVIKQGCKVEKIEFIDGNFAIATNSAGILTAHSVLVAIGRRGSPRKLNIAGEDLPKVAYRLLEPETILDKNIMVIGGGDAAVEAALMLADQNNVVLSYRKNAFSRIKAANDQKIKGAMEQQQLTVRFNTNLMATAEDHVILSGEGGEETLPNDLVFIFAGGELPIEFLQKTGIKITKKFGEIIMKH